MVKCVQYFLLIPDIIVSWKYIKYIYIYIYIIAPIVRQSKINLINKQVICPLLHRGSHFVTIYIDRFIASLVCAVFIPWLLMQILGITNVNYSTFRFVCILFLLWCASLWVPIHFFYIIKNIINIMRQRMSQCWWSNREEKGKVYNTNP